MVVGTARAVVWHADATIDHVVNQLERRHLTEYKHVCEEIASGAFSSTVAEISILDAHIDSTCKDIAFAAVAKREVAVLERSGIFEHNVGILLQLCLGHGL